MSQCTLINQIEKEGETALQPFCCVKQRVLPGSKDADHDNHQRCGRDCAGILKRRASNKGRKGGPLGGRTG